MNKYTLKKYMKEEKKTYIDLTWVVTMIYLLTIVFSAKRRALSKNKYTQEDIVHLQF